MFLLDILGVTSSEGEEQHATAVPGK